MAQDVTLTDFAERMERTCCVLTESASVNHHGDWFQEFVFHQKRKLIPQKSQIIMKLFLF